MEINKDFEVENTEDSAEPELWEIGNFQSDPVKDEAQLLDLLRYDVWANQKNRVLFLAGHFPLFYDESGAYAATSAWGAFTPYSLDLACRIAKCQIEDHRRGISDAKDIGFVLLADDINFEDFGKNSEFSRHQKSRKRDAFYRARSGTQAKLPEQFQEIFDKYGIPSDLVIRQNHGKRGREDCLFFSERILRAHRQEVKEAECAKAYRGLIESLYFIKETDYLVAFLPDMCTGNVCGRVLDDNFWVKGDWQFAGSHVSMQTDSTLLSRADIESIWKDWGVKYRRDNVCV